ncbi:AAA family ATPase [Micromonospora sp. DH14]|uniref:AAA family ATPase n=1 Tax=Micromonospora sp. DH14 TaxID=3040120 RepID=UPI002441F6F6|nr:AAA family ATPase [Micromonospora sp. DH14]MDG9674477.1 AAA family ATPase [Micromonospora sp. DH14]
MSTSPRRFFIGCGTSSYSPESGFEDRPELVDEIRRMSDLFTRYLPYQSVPGFRPNLSRQELTGQLSRFLTAADRQPDDIVVFYYTGHGETDGGDLILPFPETTSDLSRTGVWASELTNWLIRGTDVQQFLVILDTCFAAAATRDVGKGALDRLDLLGGRAVNPSIAVLAAARPHESAGSGAFSRAFDAAVRHRASGGHEPRYLALNAVYNVVRHELPPWQRARILQADDGDTVTEFLPNPRYNQTLHGLNLRAQRDHEQQVARRAEFLSHVLPRAQGLDVVVEGVWLFTGRTAALRSCAAWLRRPPGTPRSTLVVTGNPGSGKSALLSRLYMLGSRRLRSRIPMTSGNDEVDVPENVLTCFVHVRGQTVGQLLAALCQALDVDEAANVEELLSEVASRDQHQAIILDALDEAADVESVMREVVQPLVRDAGKTNVRILVGTRRHLVDRLGRDVVVLNLDDAEYADQESVRRYAERCLRELGNPSPYLSVAENLTQEVATAVGNAAGHSFLVALISARSLALRDYVVDPGDAAWRRALPRFAAEAMRRDLEDRLGESSNKARDLLLPLAYADGAGLPWEDIWAPLATTLSGQVYTDADIDWLIEHAGYYVIEALANQRSVYRLYHEALASYLRSNRSNRSIQQTIFTFFEKRSQVPATAGRAPWSEAHPYVLANLASHAAAGGNLDRLLLDPAFLTEADQNRLLAVCDSAMTEEGHAAGRAYREAVHHFGGADLWERLSYLELAARQHDAGALAERIVEQTVQRPWRALWASWTPPHPHRILGSPVDGVTALAVVPGSAADHVIAGTRQGALHCWDPLSNPSQVRVYRPRSSRISGLDVVELDGRRRLLVSEAQGQLALHDLPTLRPVARKRLAWLTSIDAASTLRAGRTLLGVAALGRRIRAVRISTGSSAGPEMQTIDRRSRRRLAWLRRDSTDVPELIKPFRHPYELTAIVTTHLAGDPVILTGTSNGHSHLWHALTGEQIASIRGDDSPTSDGIDLGTVTSAVTALLVIDHGDAKVVVRGFSDGRVSSSHLERWGRRVLWTGPVASRDAHTQAVHAMTAVRVGDEDVIVTAGADGFLRPWYLGSLRPFGPPWRGHTGPIHAVTTGVVEERPLIISGSADGTVRMWDLDARPRVTGAWQGHTRTITDMVTTTVDGRTVLVTASGDGIVRIFDGESGHMLRSWFAHTGGVTCLAIGQRSGLPVVLTTGRSGGTRVWDLSTADLVAEPFLLEGLTVTALTAGTSDEGGFGCAGDADGTVHTWCLADGQALESRPLPRPARVERLAVLPTADGPMVLVGGADGQVTVFKGQRLDKIEYVDQVARGRITALTILDDDTAFFVLVLAGDDLTIWDVASGKGYRRRLPGVTCLTAGVGGRVLLGYADGVVEELQHPTDQTSVRQRSVEGRIDAIAAFDAGEGMVVVAATEEAALAVWRPTSPDGPASGAGPRQGGVQAMARVQLGEDLAVLTVGEFGEIRFFRFSDGTEVRLPWAAHNGWIRSLTVHRIAGVPHAVTAGDDGYVQIWDLDRQVRLRRFSHSSIRPQRAADLAVVDGQRVLVCKAADLGSPWLGVIEHAIEAWNIEGAPRRLGRPWQHRDPVLAVRVVNGEDVTIAFTVSAGAMVQWWDVATGRRLGGLRFDAPVTCLAVDPTLGTVYCGSGQALYRLSLNECRSGRVRWGRGGPPEPWQTLNALVTAVGVEAETSTIAVGLQNIIVILSPEGHQRHRIELNSPIAAVEFGGPSTVLVGCAAGVVAFALTPA